MGKASPVNSEGLGYPGEMVAGPIIIEISYTRFLQLRR